MLVAPALLLAQLCALYVLGSYAMGALGSAGAGSGRMGRLLFYALVAPGVIAHESAHYLAARLTGTPVDRFVPFAPQTDASGATTFGYVRHGASNPLAGAVIGLAPVIANPAVLVALTAAITPVATASGPARATIEGIAAVAGGLADQVLAFAASEPALFALWAYLALSLALGSVPSREDLAAVPAAAALVALGGLIYASVFGVGFLPALSQAASYGIMFYLLPLLVATAAAAVGAVLRAWR